MGVGWCSRRLSEPSPSAPHTRTTNWRLSDAAFHAAQDHPQTSEDPRPFSPLITEASAPPVRAVTPRSVLLARVLGGERGGTRSDGGMTWRCLE